jgi:hypothetical protein
VGPVAFFPFFAKIAFWFSASLRSVSIVLLDTAPFAASCTAHGSHVHPRSVRSRARCFRRARPSDGREPPAARPGRTKMHAGRRPGAEAGASNHARAHAHGGGRARSRADYLGRRHSQALLLGLGRGGVGKGRGQESQHDGEAPRHWLGGVELVSLYGVPSANRRDDGLRPNKPRHCFHEPRGLVHTSKTDSHRLSVEMSALSLKCSQCGTLVRRAARESHACCASRRPAGSRARARKSAAHDAPAHGARAPAFAWHPRTPAAEERRGGQAAHGEHRTHQL